VGYRLIVPNMEIKKQFLDYLDEWKKEPRIVPDCVDLKKKTFEDWLSQNISYRYSSNVPSYMVSSTTFLLVDDSNYIYGALDFRHYLNESLLALAGHIGYGVRPSQRRKGYAKMMLNMALDIIKEKGYDKVLISCAKSNVASRNTILSQGGFMENEVLYKDEVYQRFWIYLK
jgi:predicted acetyltransferase